MKKATTGECNNISNQRRQDILQAALKCFASLGYQATTMADIIERAQASTGSVYHHFTSKEQLAAALYLAGLADYQQQILPALITQISAKSGIEAIITQHLRWVQQHPDLARYLFNMRQAELSKSAQANLSTLNRNFFKSIMVWLRPKLANGELISLPIDLFITQLIGPTQEYARLWLAGHATTSLISARRQLIAAAWRALAGPANQVNQAMINKAKASKLISKQSDNKHRTKISNRKGAKQ